MAIQTDELIARGPDYSHQLFHARGCQGDIPIEQLQRYLHVAYMAVNRAIRQNKYRCFEFIGEEELAFSCLGIDFDPRNRRGNEAKIEAVRVLQPTVTDNYVDRVATQIYDTVTSLRGACTSQIEVSKYPSAVREGASSAPPCGPTTPLESTELPDKSSETTTSEPFELECQPQGLAATAPQDQHVGTSECADTFPSVSTAESPACSTSGLDADDFSRQPHIDPMARPALADENPPKYPPPVQAEAVTPGKKVHLSLHAQPDFDHVQHEFEVNGLTLKMLWDQYRQSHPNKRTYKYSQFCNRFKDWIASQASTALSQGT